VILKIVLKAGHECAPESDGKPGKFDAAFRTLFRINKRVFKEASRNFLFIFLLNKAG
jgi:hypothetical protein